MKKIVIKTSIEVYADELELTKKDQRLLKRAKKALKVSFSPYSNFKVGVAILLLNGKTVVGSNQEVAAYSVCLCAERAALASAAALYPGVPVATIAVTAKAYQKIAKEPVSPCGACRQFIFEVENRFKQEIKIIMQGEVGQVYIAPSARSLLPLSFDGSLL